jgi:hypothetical protein
MRSADTSGSPVAQPSAPQQRFTESLVDLYRQAGEPSLRAVSRTIRNRDDFPDTVSHEVVGQLLNGHIPKWTKVECVVRYLAEQCRPPRNSERETARFSALWRDARATSGNPIEQNSASIASELSVAHFNERRLESEIKAKNNVNQIDLALEDFARRAPILEVLTLVSNLNSRDNDFENPRDDRRLLVSLLRLFARVRDLDEVIEILITFKVAGNREVLDFTVDSCALRPDAEFVALIAKLRARGDHEIAFELMREIANNLDRSGAIDQSFITAGQRTEAELLRAFRSRPNPFPV